MKRSNMTNKVLFIIDGSDPIRRSRIQKVARALRQDLEYAGAVDGIGTKIRVEYTLTALDELIAKRGHVNYLVIDDRVKNRKISPADLMKYADINTLHTIIPVIRSYPAEEYYQKGFYKGIFDADLSGGGILSSVITEGRSEEEAWSYYRIGVTEEPINEKALRTVLEEMADSSIRGVRKLAKDKKIGQARALTIYREITDSKIEPLTRKRRNRTNG